MFKPQETCTTIFEKRQESEVLDHARDLVAALLDAIRQLAQRSFHWSTAPSKNDESDWNLQISSTF